MNTKFTIPQSAIEVLKSYNVVAAKLFGSYANNKNTFASDIDILVEFNPDSKYSLLTLVRLQNQLQQILNKKVDVVTNQSVSKHILDDIQKSAVDIY